MSDRTPHFDEIVDRGRFRSASDCRPSHGLLVAAGPPPELPPSLPLGAAGAAGARALVRPPSPLHGDRGGCRRPRTVLFGLGYAVGHTGQAERAPCGPSR